MSYSTFIKSKTCTAYKLEKYYENRKNNIYITTNNYYRQLARKKADKTLEQYLSKAQTKINKKLKLEEAQYKLAMKTLKDWVIRKLEKPITLSDLKKEAFRLVQLYARLIRCDKDGMLRLVDTGKLVHYKKSQWWHYFSKFNHPNLAFEVNNIRPITQRSNQMQWDQPWLYRKDNLIWIIWQEQFDHLEAMSKEPKGELKTKEYYQTRIDHYTPLVEEQLKRIGEK